MGLVFCIASETTAKMAQQPENLALASRGSKVFSNGSFLPRYPEKNANNGKKSPVPVPYGESPDTMGPPVWSSSINYLTKNNPSKFWVEFPSKTEVNKIVIIKIVGVPPYGWEAFQDYEIQYFRADGSYVKVVPLNGEWTNPVKGNQLAINTYYFERVTTKSLRLIITKVTDKGFDQARILEFEAYNLNDKQLAAERQEKIDSFNSIKSAYREWKKKPYQPEESLVEGGEDSPHWRFIREEKIKAIHIGDGLGYYRKIADTIDSMNFNTLMPSVWLFDARPESRESNIKQFETYAAEAKQHNKKVFYWWQYHYGFTPGSDWTAEQKKNAGLIGFRRAVGFNGGESSTLPCPLDDVYWEGFWVRFEQFAIASKSYPDTLIGACIDLEGYGSEINKLTYRHCFCDDCFGRFLKAIGSKVNPESVSRSERFTVLRNIKALDDYYQILIDETVRRAKKLTRMVHALNLDFLMSFYAPVPWLVKNVQAEAANPDSIVFKTGTQYKSDWNLTGWWGYGLAKGFGTNRVPAVILQLYDGNYKDTMLAATAECLKRGQETLKSLDLNVVGTTGYWIEAKKTDPKGSEKFAGVLRTTLEHGFGYHLVDGYHFFVDKKYWEEIVGMITEPVENYIEVTRKVNINFPKKIAK